MTPQPHPPPAQAAAKTVLVVEDEPSLASTLSYNLRKNGFNVIVRGRRRSRGCRPRGATARTSSCST